MRNVTRLLFIVLSAGLLLCGLGGCTASTTNDPNSAGSPVGSPATAPKPEQEAPPAAPATEEPAEAADPAAPAGTPSADGKPTTGAGRPRQGEPCPDNLCAEGLTCLSYYGFAGARGPKFTSCEIPCVKPGSVCPSDQRCVTVADGPGEVCRPQR